MQAGLRRGFYGTAVDLQPGLAGTIEHVVGERDTSAAAGTSDVVMLATPNIILLAEQATWAALHGALSKYQTARVCTFCHPVPSTTPSALSPCLRYGVRS